MIDQCIGFKITIHGSARDDATVHGPTTSIHGSTTANRHAHHLHYVLLTLELRFNLRHVPFQQLSTLLMLNRCKLVGFVRMLQCLQLALTVFHKLSQLYHFLFEYTLVRMKRLHFVLLLGTKHCEFELGAAELLLSVQQFFFCLFVRRGHRIQRCLKVCNLNLRALL